MANQNSINMLSQGFDVQGRARDMRNQQLQNQFLLQQQQQQAKGAGLQNQIREMQLKAAQTPQPNVKYQTTPDGRFQVPVSAQTGQIMGPAQPVQGLPGKEVDPMVAVKLAQEKAKLAKMGQGAPLKIPDSLMEHLPLEIQSRPESVTLQDLVQAAEKKKNAPNDAKKIKHSEGEKAASGFYTRMNESETGLEKLLSDNPDFDPVGGFERFGAMVSNTTTSKEMQLLKNHASDWIRAKLRKESGAAIGVDEMENEFELYFPQYGDSPEVIAQKTRKRKTATEAMKTSAGGAIKTPVPSGGTGDLSMEEQAELAALEAEFGR